MKRHPYNDEARFEKIAEVFLGGYAWGIACVFRDRATGRLYGDTDSGCSCYEPFDEAEWPGQITLERCKEIHHEREAAALLDGLSGEDASGPSTIQRQNFCRSVRAALATHS